jgi:uncharacterized protein YvpB
MDKNIIYGHHDIFLCIKCKKIMYYNNYYKHLKTKIHKENLEKKNLNYNKEKKNYLIEFN